MAILIRVLVGMRNVYFVVAFIAPPIWLLGLFFQLCIGQLNFEYMKIGLYTIGFSVPAVIEILRTNDGVI